MRKYIIPQLSKIPHRAEVSTQEYIQLSNRLTAHIDAWLVLAHHDDQFYFVIEVRRGGFDLVETRVFRATPGNLTPVYAHKPQGVLKTCDGPWAREAFPWLPAIHTKLIQPTIRKVPWVSGVKEFTRVSVKLHYIYSDHSVNDPMEGVANFYEGTAREARDLQRMTPEARAEREREVAALGRYLGKAGRVTKASPWNAKERSILRTCDKLLKPMPVGLWGKPIRTL